MGIALGFALLAGVRSAIVDQEAAAIVLATAFALAGRFGARAVRPLVLIAAFGLVAGTLAGELRQVEGRASRWTADPSLFSGRITSDPRAGGRGTSARFEWRDEAGITHRSLVFLPAGFEAGRGDRIELAGQVDDQLGDLIYADRARLVEPSGRIEMARRSIRGGISDRIQQSTPGSAGTLALGLLIGDDSALTPREREDLRRSGLSHITAVSGWNVTVVIGFVALMLRALGRNGLTWFTLQAVAIAGYVWIVGAEPPILRAAIMGALALVAFAAGRPAHLPTLLVLSAAVMTMHDPVILGSLSFQLSFLATIGLMVAAATIERSETWTGRLLGLASAPVAAALATSPLLAAHFGILSLGTVPANLVVEPLVPAATFLGALTALTAGIPVLGVLTGTLLWLVCSLVLEVSRVVSSAPGLTWTFSPLSPAATVSIYLALALVAAPAIPECRAALRDLSAWAEARPRTAAFTAASTACVLVGAVLVLVPN